MYDKNIIRKEMLAKRNALALKEIEKNSAIITDKILQSKEFTAAKTVFTYLSMNSEVSTYELVKHTWRHGKKAAVPVVLSGDPNMQFRIIDSFDNLVQSRFGVMEPCQGEAAVPDNDSLIIVPGLVFDRNKNRIGYGGGYYDRYLRKNKMMANIGICFSFQIIDFIKCEEHDIPVDKIITESTCF